MIIQWQPFFEHISAGSIIATGIVAFIWFFNGGQIGNFDKGCLLFFFILSLVTGALSVSVQ
jgi:hypothetical protein